MGTGTFCDLDGVLANWDDGAARILGLEPDPTIGITDRPGVHKGDLWKRIDRAGASFWANLPPYPWAERFVAELMRFDDFTILSSPSNDASSAQGKVLWMQKFFKKKNFRDYILTNKKYQCAGPGAILIDDKEKHVDAFTAAGGIGILFPQPWNRNRGINNPVEYVLDIVQSLYPNRKVA